MSNIKQLVLESIKNTFMIPLTEELNYIIELAKPELNDNEYAVARIEKHKERRLNPKTNRIKKFKTTKWLKTTIPPEERTLKNLPRDSNKKAKVKFQDWLELKNGSRSPHSVGQAPDGTWYGWSHRAIAGFNIGKEIKTSNIIGNKHTYGSDIDKKYHEISKKDGYEVADKWRDNLPFTPYKIKTDEEAFQHAERFARDVA